MRDASKAPWGHTRPQPSRELRPSEICKCGHDRGCHMAVTEEKSVMNGPPVMTHIGYGICTAQNAVNAGERCQCTSYHRAAKCSCDRFRSNPDAKEKCDKCGHTLREHYALAGMSNGWCQGSDESECSGCSCREYRASVQNTAMCRCGHNYVSHKRIA